MGWSVKKAGKLGYKKVLSRRRKLFVETLLRMATGREFQLPNKPTLKLNPCTIHYSNIRPTAVNQCDLLCQNTTGHKHNSITQSVIDYFNISNFCTNKVRKFSNSP